MGSNGKVCYVVYVPESEEAQHFLNNKKGAYIRTDEFSGKYEPRLATADELLHLFDRRRLAVEQRQSLIRRAAERFEQYAAREYTTAAVSALRERTGPVGARMQLAIVPRFPVAPLCEPARAVQIVRNTHIDWRRGPFPAGSSPISQHESALLTETGGDFSLLEVNTWGLVSYAGEIQRFWTPPGGGREIEIHLHSLLGQVLAIMEYARTIYELLGYDGTLEVIASMTRVRGVPLVHYPHDFREVIASSRFDDDVGFSFSVSTERLRVERDLIATELIHTVLFSLGWTAAAKGDADASVTAGLLRAAYTYNSWGSPASRSRDGADA